MEYICICNVMQCPVAKVCVATCMSFEMRTHETSITQWFCALNISITVSFFLYFFSSYLIHWPIPHLYRFNVRLLVCMRLCTICYCRNPATRSLCARISRMTFRTNLSCCIFLPMPVVVFFVASSCVSVSLHNTYYWFHSISIATLLPLNCSSK